jgi:hypothetical protein
MEKSGFRRFNENLSGSRTEFSFLWTAFTKVIPSALFFFGEQTKEKLSYDRDLGPFTLPEPKKEYPIDYVLDGQQRLTSIFSTFQTDLKQNPNTKVNWTDIYFDLEASPNAQDSQFVALDSTEVKEATYPSASAFRCRRVREAHEVYHR